MVVHTFGAAANQRLKRRVSNCASFSSFAKLSIGNIPYLNVTYAPCSRRLVTTPCPTPPTPCRCPHGQGAQRVQHKHQFPQRSLPLFDEDLSTTGVFKCSTQLDDVLASSAHRALGCSGAPTPPLHLVLLDGGTQVGSVDSH